MTLKVTHPSTSARRAQLFSDLPVGTVFQLHEGWDCSAYIKVGAGVKFKLGQTTETYTFMDPSLSVYLCPDAELILDPRRSTL